MSSSGKTLFAALAAGFLIGSTSLLEAAEPQQDWPQFLGPHRNGISTETGLIDRIPDEGPKSVWRVPGGVGMSGLTIANGRLVTLVQRQGQQFALVLDAGTGKTQHAVAVAPAYENSMGNGPRATPAVAGETAFVFTGEGVLAAIDLKAGNVLWSRNPVKELGGQVADYGMASSPLIVGTNVVVTVGASKGTVAAYDLKSGKPAWQSIAGNGADTAGYSSPALLNAGGKEQIVAFEGKAAIGIAPDGKLLWRYPYETGYDCNVATPIAYKGQVFISAGENNGSELLKVQPANSGYVLTPVWASHGPRSVMRNEWQTSVLLDGFLYGFDNSGSAGPITNLNCVDIETGERKWQQARFGKGNLIAADGKLFLSTMKGELVLVRATPQQYEELGRAEVIGTTRQAPALANGLLYLRDDQEIVCLDMRKAN